MNLYEIKACPLADGVRAIIYSATRVSQSVADMSDGIRHNRYIF
jgi:hypothetical protein